MMAKARTYDHVHKYQLVTYESGKKILKCVHEEGCPHFMPVPEAAIGRQSICWGCGQIMILNIETIKMKQPMCMPCREERKEQRKESAALPIIEV